MKKIYLHLVFILLSLAVTQTLRSQSNIMVTAQYLKSSTADILNDISNQYHTGIYYKVEDLSPVLKTYQWKSTALPDVLKELLDGTDLMAISYRDYAFVIVKKEALDRNTLVEFYNNVQKVAEDKQTVKTNIIQLGELSTLGNRGKALIKGRITDGLTEETVIGANILFTPTLGTTSDYDGNYEFNLDPGIYEMVIKYIGYQDFIATIDIRSSSTFDVKMKREVVNLDEITVTAIAKNASVQETQTGIARIDIKSLDKLPTFLGERDVVKAVLLNPGVSTIGEGATGFNVRGGNVDQNLVLQDEGILFNASHALGFFSTFNTDLIRDASLSKGNLPADQGGRLASALVVNLKDGNPEKFRLKASFNPVSATISMDGPVNDKTSFILGGRSTFSDYIFGLFSNPDVKKSSASFYDLNAKVSTRISGGNRFSISGYASKDNFRFSDQFGFAYGSYLAQLSWNKLYSDKVTNKVAVVGSKYFSEQSNFKSGESSVLSSGINYLRFIDKLVVTGNQTKLELGLNSMFYDVAAGSIKPLDSESIQPESSLEKENAIESAIFASYETKISNRLEVVLGARLNHFISLGPQNVYNYLSGVVAADSINGSEIKSGIIKSYLKPEPRVSIKLNVSKNSSLKVGYARTSQFINQIFNADTPTPTSQWQLSNQYLEPNVADNFSAGFFKNFNNDDWETSLEVYYRQIGRLYDYKDFANLLVNDHLETELLKGIGKSRGLELSIKKNTGVFNGWMSYTYSNTSQQITGINNGNWFNSNFDKPHNFSLIVNYQPVKRHTLTANFTYSTGRPTTPPITSYLTPDNIYVPIYSDRNLIRIPAYHRLDVSYNIARTHNQAAKVITSWTFSVYNLYGRKNPYSVFYTRGFNNSPQANRLAVVGTVIPSIRFNIEFI